MNIWPAEWNDYPTKVQQTAPAKSEAVAGNKMDNNANVVAPSVQKRDK